MESNTASQLKTLLDTIRDSRESLSNPERLQLIGLADELKYELEKPGEAVSRVTFNEPGHFVSIRVAIQLGLFDALGDVGEPGMSSTELAERAGADPRLVARFMRHLAANGTVRETDVDTYASTRLSSSFRQESFKDAIIFKFDDFLPVTLSLPSFLASISYQNPTSIEDGVFSYAYKMPKKSLYTYLNENPEIGKRFGGMIQVSNTGKPHFWDEGYYPVHDRLVQGGPTTDEDVLLVDIGGGDGGDLGKLRKSLGPDVKGRLVLQELKHIVDRSDQDGYEAQVGDWNAVQPIKGARAYMLHHILHDFSSDDACRRILTNIKLAMQPGYSKLLIKERLMPDRNAPWSFTGLDVSLMQSLSGEERTESQFRNLLESVGFNIEGIWRHENTPDAVIEASLSKT